MKTKYIFSLVCVAGQLVSVHLLAQPGVPVHVSPEVLHLLNDGKYADAEALVVHSTNADARLIAWLELEQGKTAEGSNLIEKTISQATTNQIEAIVNSINIMGDASTESAIGFAQKYLNSEQYHNVPRIEIALAGLYLKNKETEMAKPLLDVVLQTSYTGLDLRNALFKLTLSYYEAGKPEVALDYFQKLFKKFPETSLDPGYQLQWCHIAIAAGRSTEALAKLDKLQTDFPDYYAPNVVLFHMAKANAFESLGDANRAQTELQAMASLADKYPQFAGLVEIAKNKLVENTKRTQMLEAANKRSLDKMNAALSDNYSNDAGGRWKRIIVLLVLCSVSILGLLILIFSLMKKSAETN